VIETFSRVFRPAIAGAVVAVGLMSAPVHAGPEENAFLQAFVGEWRGRGTLVGASEETVVCRLSLSPGNQDKVNYSGRCTIAGNTLSINGTLAYIDASRRYEAAMTTNATFSGLAVGQRRGNQVIFNLREREQDEGRDMTINAQIALNSSAISVQFSVVYDETGESLSASVPFSR
jgi:hypothetical protein